MLIHLQRKVSTWMDALFLSAQLGAEDNLEKANGPQVRQEKWHGLKRPQRLEDFIPTPLEGTLIVI